MCEENFCQNEGVCYEMNSGIQTTANGPQGSLVAANDLGVGASVTEGGTTHPSSVTVSSAIYPKQHPTTNAIHSTSVTVSDGTVTSQETTSTSPSTTIILSSETDPSISATTTIPITAAQYATFPNSSASKASVTPPPVPSTPSDLNYTIGVIPPRPGAPLLLCPPPFQLMQGLCLYLSDTEQSAGESRRLCRNLDGRLADIVDRAELLTRLAWPPPPPPRRRLYAWVDAAVGFSARRRQRRTLVGRRLCTAASAATGRLMLRRCEELHRSFCEREPVRTAPHHVVPRSVTPVTEVGEQKTDEACHCKDGYGGADCVTAVGNEGHEFVYCQDPKIGNGGSHIVIDYGIMGRLPWQTRLPPSNCPEPDVPLPDSSDGCLVPSSLPILRYWCQGKEECRPSIDFLTAFTPDACDFEDGLNVTMRLYLRHREEKLGSVSYCIPGHQYHGETNTCYFVIPDDSYSKQTGLCRISGGDVIYNLDSSKYPGFIDFLREMFASAGDDLGLIWLSGSASEPRPVVDMTIDTNAASRPCLHLDTGAEDICDSGMSLPAVCAVPPLPGEPTPDCPPVRFDEFGLAFPETAAGFVARQPCGAGYSGTASYKCGWDGQWSSPYPDLRACHSEDINTGDVKTRLDDGTEPVSEIVSELATNVTKRTSQSQPLTPGDVISSVQLLPQMVMTQQAQLGGPTQDRRQVASQYLGNVTSLVSGLTQVEISWHGMPDEQRSDTSTVLQKNVEQSAYLLAAYLEEQHQDFSYDTIRLRTGRYSSLEGNLEYATEQGSTVNLPDEVGRFNQSGKTSIVFVEYANMDCLLRAEKCSTPEELHKQNDVQYSSFVNSPVVSASVGNTSVELLHSNVTLTFRTRLSAGEFNLTNYQCAYWDVGLKRWDTEGCHLGRVTNESVECLCRHLTSFATLMDINGVIEEGSVLDLALSWLTTIGCVVSLISLAACLVVFTAIPALRSERTAVHRNLCLCLFTAEFILLVGLQPHGSSTGCAIVAGLLHFFFLAAFAWMCIEGVQIYIMVHKVFATRKSYLRYFYICGYGIPALIVIISLSITKGEGYGSETACWLSTENGLIWAFAGPLLLVVLVNILALVMALRVTARATRGRSTKAPPQASTWIRGSASLVAILGTTWLFGFLYFSNGLLFFSIVFTILNSLQGFFIFLFHVWLNEKNRTEARRFMWKTTNRMGLTEHDLTTTSAGVSSRSQAGQTVETSVAGPAVSSRPDIGGTGASSTDTNGRTHTNRGDNNPVMRALQRVKGAHYSVKRVDGEAQNPTSANPETLRRLESNRPTNTNA